jgi:hypothetical protein
MAATLIEWDARLARTPDGAPAHLLSHLPQLPRAGRHSRLRG